MYVGTYKLGKKRWRKWLHVAMSRSAMDLNIEPVPMDKAVRIMSENDARYTLLARVARKQLKKLGYDERRGDSLSMVMSSYRPGEVILTLEKGDESLPERGAGFGPV